MLNTTVVSWKYPPPPFCNLSLSTKHRGGLIRGMRQFLSQLCPPSDKAWLHCYLSVGGWRPSARRRDAPDTSGRLTSFSVEGWESRALPRSSWCVHCWCGLSAFVVDTLMVDSQVHGLAQKQKTDNPMQHTYSVHVRMYVCTCMHIYVYPSHFY